MWSRRCLGTVLVRQENCLQFGEEPLTGADLLMSIVKNGRVEDALQGLPTSAVRSLSRM